jgi:hypothetical protein
MASGTVLASGDGKCPERCAVIRAVMLLAFLLVACAPLPPTPADIEAKRFEPVPGKAVIYLVRDIPDFTDEPATVMLDDHMMGTTYPGTYFRWVVEPGRRHIRGFAGDAGSIALDLAPDRMYFVQQRVSRFFHGFAQSFFSVVPEPHGRAAVMRGSLIGG